MGTSYSKAEDLGWCIAKIKDGALTIVSPACIDEGVYTPAQSVTLYGYAQLSVLKELIDGWVNCINMDE